MSADLPKLDLDPEGFTIKDEKHNTIPRTPAERKADRETNAWLKKAERKARDKGRKR